MTDGQQIGYWVVLGILPFLLAFLVAALISRRNNYSVTAWLLALTAGAMFLATAGVFYDYPFLFPIVGGGLFGWLLRSSEKSPVHATRSPQSQGLETKESDGPIRNSESPPIAVKNVTVFSGDKFRGHKKIDKS